ncbi:hypothetical protein T11_2679 [Trichinella zimbabwensis]|uniref:Uncharacterized protein n=1 Tax=Trichinella zimbabwensis TaxID=268475 RepID=A0A0V1HTL7_9BILA|nr:hypothetical protein T11_2679 [Trichinella zimbabwensis]
MGQVNNIQHEGFSEIFLDQRAYAVLEQDNGHTLLFGKMISKCNRYFLIWNVEPTLYKNCNLNV